MKRSFVIDVFASGALLLAATPAYSQQESGYSVQTGTGQSAYSWRQLGSMYMLEARKGGNFPNCAGPRQSPVNLLTSSLPQPSATATFTMRYSDVALGDQQVMRIQDNGHTVELVADRREYGRGQNTDEKPQGVTVGNASYKLLQAHFHHPSEHLLNNTRYPMEMHLVHGAEGGNKVVVALLLEVGTPVSPDLNVFFSRLQRPTDAEGRPSIARDGSSGSLNTESADRGRDFSWKRLLPAGTYVTYPGSLTTPGCDENVTWYVATTPVKVSQAQVDKFKSFYIMNARPAQALGTRSLTLVRRADATPEAR